MGVILTNFPSSLSSASFPFSTYKVNTIIASVYRLNLKATDLRSKSSSGFSFNSVMAVKASPEIKGIGPDFRDYMSESDDDEEEEHLFSGNLALDPKLQQKLEHKMKMKFGKKIRLRHKKLVRKRRLMKKGKWPLSKARNL